MQSSLQNNKEIHLNRLELFVGWHQNLLIPTKINIISKLIFGLWYFGLRNSKWITTILGRILSENLTQYFNERTNINKL
jgi:hypothetical protein